MFVRGGDVSPGNTLYDAGILGYYWSSISDGSYRAYRLNVGPYGVDPSDYYYRYYGYSVRCVALGG